MAANAKSKYEVLDRISPAQSESVEPPPPQERAAAARPKATPSPVSTARQDKPLAKSKDPAMKNYTLILNMDIHADASFLLKKMRTGEDMSDLANRLLTDWVQENKARIN